MKVVKFFYGMLMMAVLNSEAMQKGLFLLDDFRSTPRVGNRINPNTNPGEDCKMQQKLIDRMYQFMIKKDIDGLSSLLDDDFVLQHMTGMRQNKKEYLDAIKDGTLNYCSSTLDNIIVKDDLNFIGQNQVSASVFGGGTHSWHLQLEIELTKAGLIRKMKASTY